MKAGAPTHRRRSTWSTRIRPSSRGVVLEIGRRRIQFQGMTYQEFWPRYLRQHSRAATRRVHVLGTCAGLLLLVGAVLNLDWRLAAVGVVVGYGGAWLSHAFIERNRPETFSHPLWSFLSDLRMTWLYLRGDLRQELRRHGIQ